MSYSSLNLKGIKPWIHHTQIKWALPEENSSCCWYAGERWTYTHEGSLKFSFRGKVAPNVKWQCYFLFLFLLIFLHFPVVVSSANVFSCGRFPPKALFRVRSWGFFSLSRFRPFTWLFVEQVSFWKPICKNYLLKHEALPSSKTLHMLPSKNNNSSPSHKGFPPFLTPPLLC